MNIANLSPEQKREIISKACGHCIFEGSGAVETRDGTTSIFCRKCGKPNGSHELPDYLNDLNAMHEAEKVIHEKADYGNAWSEYFTWLLVIVRGKLPNNEWTTEIYKTTKHIGVDRFSNTDIIHATASQRAAAFLLTID